MRVLRFVAIGALVLLTGYFAGQAVQASSPVPGSESDPLVTKSYVDEYIRNEYNRLAARQEALDREIASIAKKINELKQQVKAEVRLVLGQKTAYIGGAPYELEVAPYLSGGGTTMIPFRFVGEALGANVSWESSTRSVNFYLEHNSLRLQIDSTRAVYNGREITLETPPRLVRGTTVVPLRVVSELLGAEVKWDQATKTITVLRY